MQQNEALALLKAFLDHDSVIKSVIDYGDHFLFIAHSSDPLEGDFDPFYSVNKRTRMIRDFSPQDYPEPLDVIKRLQSVYVEEGLPNG